MAVQDATERDDIFTRDYDAPSNDEEEDDKTGFGKSFATDSDLQSLNRSLSSKILITRQPLTTADENNVLKHFGENQ